ncbi:AI-2E family transporter [Mariniluteicoccus flavus]
MSHDMTADDHTPMSLSHAEEHRTSYDEMHEPDRSDWGLPRVLLILLSLAAAWFVLQGVQGLKDMVGPVFLAINLVLAVSPLQSFLVKHRAPRWLAAVVAGAVVLLFLIVFLVALGGSITMLVTELPAYKDKFMGMWDQILALLGRFGISQDQLTQQAKGINPQSIVSVLSGVLSNVSGVASLLAVVVTVILFLMMDSVNFGERMDKAAKFHPRIIEAMRSFAEGVRRYWVVTTIFGLIVGVINVIELWIIGVPLALAWGVLSFLTNYIPNIGFILGLVPPALMALLDKGPWAALAVVIGYSLVNFIVQSVIQPKFTGDAVGVTPTIAFISLILWAWVLGPLGALLALPCTLLAKAVLIDSDPNARWANALFAADMRSADARTTAEAVEPEKEMDGKDKGDKDKGDKGKGDQHTGDDGRAKAGRTDERGRHTHRDV